MKFNSLKILLLSSPVILILAYNLPLILPKYLGKFVYYKGVALGICLAFLFIKKLCKDNIQLKWISSAIFYISLNNLLDELFFDPLSFQINDYLIAISIILIEWRLQKRKICHKHQKKLKVD